MGRAQGKVSDRFSGVFGERRGLGTDYDPDQEVPLGLFGRTVEESHRRMTVLNWLLRNEALKDRQRTSLEHISIYSGGYNDGTKAMSVHEDACYNDLQALIEKGLCYKQTRDQRTVDYYASPYQDWSEEHQNAIHLFINGPDN